ncbi:MAG: pyridoxamine 5'-phosphate oxidase [Cellvibrionales bacterium]|nr:pyridoxamine 5'-phosphate oxidase [Cellvibrionales bacterium]
MKLYDVHNEYSKGHLDKTELTSSPFELAERWIADATRHHDIEEANKMVLATVDPNGQPFQRVVLLKEITSKHLVFFTNYHSRKGQHIASNNQVSLLFFWSSLERQIHFTGRATPLSHEQSETYFHSRPYASQLAAAASHQSHPIANKQVLLDKVEQLKQQYPEQIPMPCEWGGYNVSYDSVEFWQGGEHRLHDRFIYQLKEAVWEITQLAP